MLRLRLLVPVLVTLFATTAVSATAATITVNTTGDGTSPGECSLREAILDVDSPGSPVGDCAAAAFGANTIMLGANTYTIALGASSLSVSATVTTLTIQGAGDGLTTISGAPISGGQLANTVLEIAQGATVNLNGVTITNGHGQDGSQGADGTGGDGNDGADGGGIYNQGTLTLNYSAVTNSQAGNGGAGGAGGLSEQGGTGGNGGGGGGIYNTGTLTLNGSTLSGDTAGAGGAGGVGGANASGVGGNGGTGGDGGFGGALLNASGTVTISASTFSGDASGTGGAGGLGGAGSTTGGAGGTGGQGKYGGGIDGTLHTGGSVTITNSTFASDTAGNGGVGGGGGTGGTLGGDGGPGGAGGGGGAVQVFPGSMTLQSDTIAGNSAGAGAQGGQGGTGPTAGTQGSVGDGGTGGGLGADGSATVQNTLLASNSGGNCGGVTVTDSGHNLSFGDSSCPGTFASGDPDLGALELNGGATQTISLQPGSAAINQIPPTGAGCQPTDQRSVARPSGPACDIGAYEVAPPTAQTGAASVITTTSASLASTVTPNAGTTTVTFDYGPTAKYGETKTVSGITGVAAVPADTDIKGLKPHTTYHYRVVVTTIDGSAAGSDRTFKTKALPAISRLKASRSGKTIVITYRDSEAATTTLKIRRGSKTVATITHHDKAGSNRVKVKVKHLTNGEYGVRATPRFDRQNGATATAKFRVT
jgi:CSLREA domain-containing protein